MRLSRHLLTAIPLLGAVLFGQSSGQDKSQADHMEHHFDPKQSAKRASTIRRGMPGRCRIG